MIERVSEVLTHLRQQGYYAAAAVTGKLVSGPFVLPQEAVIIAARDGRAHVRLINEAFLRMRAEQIARYVLLSMQWAQSDAEAQLEDFARGYFELGVQVTRL